MEIKYIEYNQELLKMLDEDQQGVRAYSRAFQNNEPKNILRTMRKDLNAKHKQRYQRMLAIINEIQEPSIENIGKDGLLALSVLALHSKHSILKQVLEKFENVFSKNPKQMDGSLLPAMIDRVLLLEGKKQRFGTQWMIDENRKPFLYPVEDFKKMNGRRAKYGLKRLRRPRDLTYGIPKGPLPPFAKGTDQKEPTKKEYDEFTEEMRD